MLESCGHEILVANARKVRLIYEGHKSDKLDAENLARLARLDPKLLSPLKHRGEASQAHLALVRSREALVSSRTKLVNHVRGALKSFGGRLPKCSAQSFHKKAAADIPEPLKPALEPLLETIGSLSTRIRHFDRELEARQRHVGDAVERRRARQRDRPGELDGYRAELRADSDRAEQIRLASERLVTVKDAANG